MGRVSIVPVEASAGLPFGARAVLQEMAGYANKDGKAWPSIDTLAEGLGVTPQTVYKWRRYLVEKGLLIKVGGGHRGLTAIYRLSWALGRRVRRAANLRTWRKGKRSQVPEHDLKVGGATPAAHTPYRQRFRREVTPQPPSFAEVMATQAALVGR